MHHVSQHFSHFSKCKIATTYVCLYMYEKNGYHAHNCQLVTQNITRFGPTWKATRNLTLRVIKHTLESTFFIIEA